MRNYKVFLLYPAFREQVSWKVLSLVIKVYWDKPRRTVSSTLLPAHCLASIHFLLSSLSQHCLHMFRGKLRRTWSYPLPVTDWDAHRGGGKCQVLCWSGVLYRRAEPHSDLETWIPPYWNSGRFCPAQRPDPAFWQFALPNFIPVGWPKIC